MNDLVLEPDINMFSPDDDLVEPVAHQIEPDINMFTPEDDPGTHNSSIKYYYMNKNRVLQDKNTGML